MKCPNCQSESFYIDSYSTLFIEHKGGGKVNCEQSIEEYGSNLKCRYCDNVIFKNIKDKYIDKILETNTLEVFQ